jgi:DNA-directed RNA polymerase specialized sigma24 family protein
MKETENLLEHCAAQAWSQLGPQRIEPVSLEAGKSGKTSAVYRIGGVESGGSAITSRLVEEDRIRQTLRKIVNRLIGDPVLQEDLMQEGCIRLWQLEVEQPGRTRSWYLQNCRFHLQHWLELGRSLDSRKRAKADKRVTLDGVDDDLLCPTGDKLFEMVSARDIVSTLAGHLDPCESAVVGGLADGLRLREIAAKLNLSYPTALKYRRKIAALTIKLGISTPSRALRSRNAAGSGVCRGSDRRRAPGLSSSDRNGADGCQTNICTHARRHCQSNARRNAWDDARK